ncbi:PDZ domain-containing protein [Novosphingobium resinovorum]
MLSLVLGSEALSSPAVAAAPDEPWPVTLRQQMARVTSIGYRLNRAAVGICEKQASTIGVAIDDLGAYEQSDRSAISQLLGMGEDPQIAVVVKGGPADIAGVHAGDALVSIDGRAVRDIIASSSDKALIADELEQRLAQFPATAPLTLGLRRDGKDVQAQVRPERTCAARFVIKTGQGITAFSDGNNVAISSRLIDFTINDDELALVAGHELGHVAYQDGTAPNIAERRRMEDRADAVGLQLATCAALIRKSDCSSGYAGTSRTCCDCCATRRTARARRASNS